MKMIIFQHGNRYTQIDLYGLVDQSDARILYQECQRLVDAQQNRLVIDLMQVSRISEHAFDAFQALQLLCPPGMLTFVAPQLRLQTKLQQYGLNVHPLQVASEVEVIH